MESVWRGSGKHANQFICVIFIMENLLCQVRLNQFESFIHYRHGECFVA